MPRFELLNAKQHHNLRLVESDGVLPQFTPVVTSEFSNAAPSCPIVLTKSPETGEFIVGALFGLKSDEPPLKSLEERGGFEPLFFQCRGFYVSEQNIAIDRDDLRFSESLGDLLFTETQQPAERLRRIQNALGALQIGQEKTREFIKCMLDHKLVEPVDLSFQFDNGEKLQLRGLYTVSMDLLNQLDDATLVTFFRSGYLELAYVMSVSLKQFGLLAYARNHRLRG